MPRDYKTPLFQHRQYEWLADFAKRNLTGDQKRLLAAELYDTNPQFNRTRFLKAASGEQENSR